MKTPLSLLLLGILWLFGAIAHAQTVLEHDQERIARVEALSLFNTMRNLGSMNNGTYEFVALFESEGSSTVPNDFPPVCDNIEGSRRTQYGEAMNVDEYAREMESLARPQVDYQLLDLGNLTVNNGSGTIDVTFEKQAEIKKKCQNNSFPTGMKVKQKAIVHFLINDKGRVDRSSFRIRSIDIEGEATPTSNAFVLDTSPSGLYPVNNARLRFREGQEVNTNRRGILPDGTQVPVDKYIPDDFWTFLTEEGRGKTKKRIEKLKSCNCKGRPYIRYDNPNRLDIGLRIGTPLGQIQNGATEAELSGITTEGSTWSLSWTRYFNKKNRGRGLFGVSVQSQTEKWDLRTTAPFVYESSEVDPDGDAYIRQTRIQNLTERVHREQINVSLEGGYAYSLPLNGIPGVLLEGRFGLDYTHTLASNYNATAEGLFSGRYPDLFGVTMAANGIYDFGQFDLAQNSASPLEIQGLGAHIALSVSWRPAANGFGLSLSAQYQWVQWNTARSSDAISTGPTQLESALSLSSGVSRSLFAFQPSLFLQF